jgi:hypothetical protein
MLWFDDEKHPFYGIAEKLKRSDENIGNLHREIIAFFELSKYPVLPNPDCKEWQEAVDYHRDLIIPKRFSVLSGEIVHHLRSCLDHIVWHFSSLQYRRDFENAIEFPIWREEPITTKEISRYERKIEGVTNPTVRKLIGDYQPYKRGCDSEDDPICIVHDMDRFDKHRELALVFSCANVTFPPDTSLDAIRAVIKYRNGEPITMAERAVAQKTVKQDAKVFPQIAIPQFGKRKDQFVVPSLSQLHEAIVERVDVFADEV